MVAGRRATPSDPSHPSATRAPRRHPLRPGPGGEDRWGRASANGALTEREVRILALTAADSTNREMALTLTEIEECLGFGPPPTPEPEPEPRFTG